jgi:hypothetical protein
MPFCEKLVTKVANVLTTSVEKLALTTARNVAMKAGRVSLENKPERNAKSIFLTTSIVSDVY